LDGLERIISAALWEGRTQPTVEFLTELQTLFNCHDTHGYSHARRL